MTDRIGEQSIPAEPDTTPGQQRDVSIAAVIRQNDALQRELVLMRGTMERVVQNQQWVNGMVEMAMGAISQMPGVGVMMQKMMGEKKK